MADGAGYSSTLSVTNGIGGVTYSEAASTDSCDVVVSSTGAISASTTLTPGTYTVGGGDLDSVGDTGTWSFTLIVSPTTLDQGAHRGHGGRRRRLLVHPQRDQRHRGRHLLRDRLDRLV